MVVEDDGDPVEGSEGAGNADDVEEGEEGRSLLGDEMGEPVDAEVDQVEHQGHGFATELQLEVRPDDFGEEGHRQRLDALHLRNEE